MKLVDENGEIKAWLKYVLGGIGGALITAGGGVWLNYSDFRKGRIEANSAATEQTISASEELRPLIDKFIALSLGTGEVTTKDRERLTAKIRDAYNKAEDVNNRWSGLDQQFQKYTSALVALNEGASNLTGPLDGKQFTRAYSSYIVADQNWRKAVQRRQNSYIASF